MHGVSRLTNLRILALNNNGILQIEGLKDLIYLKVLKLAGKCIMQLFTKKPMCVHVSIAIHSDKTIWNQLARSYLQ